jgi:hypothetical protein
MDEMINMPWYFKLLLAMGGAALLWKVAKDGVKAGTKMAVKAVLARSPRIRKLAIAHAKHIDDLINEIEAGVEEAIQEAADADKPVTPPPSPPLP